MPLDAATFEKLGSFYLGRPVDPGTRQPADVPFLYDSRDLVTHAVCVGMTGSGKTGLCVGLLEEAAIDGIPALILDPKGDLANLALQFPRLEPADFRPWVSADEAARADLTLDALAEKQSQLWRNGLAAWGQDGARIERLRSAAEVAVFTPGSNAGRPVSVLSSFAAPDAAVREDAELLAERVESTAGALLGLAGIALDATSREQTLLATILTQAWTAGESLSLVEVVRRIQKPPFDTVGVLDLEAFYPEKERFKLVLALNNLIASPGFATWQQGEPLDVQSLLFTPTGKPRLAVLSIAHLDDNARMFFVSLLLNSVVSWMRAQSGTTSLRALLYMDEVFGFLPPVANPPSKRPLLTLLKQARAFGLGVALATQNPSDLDYKALANAGTWFIGRLQTERDRARLLDGLGDAGASDRATLEALLADLGKRQFVMNNVHESAPVRFETRWTLSYLCGPLTRDQIRRLPGGPSRTAPETAAADPPVSEALAAESGPPVLKDVPQFFARPGATNRWAPRFLVSATLRYRDARRGLDASVDEVWVAPFGDAFSGVDWSAATTGTSGDFTEKPAEGTFATIPTEARNARRYAAWEKDAADWLATNRPLEMFRCGAPKAESKPGETERDFCARVALQAREARDAEVAAIRAGYAKKLDALQAQIQRANEAVTREQAQAGQARMQTMLSVGSTILGAFLGRKPLSASTLGRATTAARGMGRVMKESGEVGTAKEKLAAAEARRTELESAMTAEIAALAAKADPPEIETVRIPPARGGVKIRLAALAWVPA